MSKPHIQEADINSTFLVIAIKNNAPIELMDLAISMSSLHSQFVQFNKENGNYGKANLHIKEIKAGSIIIKLMDMASGTLIPFAENFNTIIGFSEYLFNIFKYFLKEEGAPPKLRSKDCNDLKNIVSVITKDSNAFIDWRVGDNNNIIINNYLLNSLEGNALQNKMNEINKELQGSVVAGIKEKQLLRFTQIRTPDKKSKANRGIIENISKDECPIIIEDEAIKKILTNNPNPLKCIFSVDVQVEILKEENKIYKILKLWDFSEM